MHEYYLRGFTTIMHMSLSKGGYIYNRAGHIVCPTLPEIHKKVIRSSSGKENRDAEFWERWKIDGVEKEFVNGAEIISTYELKAVKPNTVDW